MKKRAKETAIGLFIIFILAGFTNICLQVIDHFIRVVL